MNPAPASSRVARTGRAFLTLLMILAADLVVATIIVTVAVSTLVPKGASVPWGRFIGESAGAIMFPAIILWGLSLFLRTAGAFWIISVLICLPLLLSIFGGREADTLIGEAIFNGFLFAVGSIVAASIIAYRKRWKP